MKKSILISGVGGQGTLLASRIIGEAALSMGYDVKISEVHGMSQRGGSVVTFVRYGDEKIASPLIDLGGADVLLAFELLEAYRSLAFVRRGGAVFANSQRINPMPVIMGTAVYPEGIEEKIRASDIELIEIDARELARGAGNEKAVNTVMIGRLAAGLDIPKEVWQKTIEALVPEKFINANLNAFEAGYAYK